MPSPRFHLPIRTRVACLATLALALITSRASTATAQDTSTRRDSASQTKQKQSQSKGTTAAKPAPKPKPVWPVKGPTPLPGSILPNKRIVAYYGNPLSKRMGILGELPPDEMLKRLDREVKAWERADSTTPVVPALHLIAVVAQGSAGRDGLYRARMGDSLIERVYGWAQRQKAIMFLDIQVAKSTLQAELPRLTTFLSRPDVHLGLDPEFSMKRGGAPGKRIGTYDAADINYAIDFLADLVQKHNLPPKVLVIHRFTRPMVTNASKIKLDPRVQVVMHMDGWGPPWMKIDSYQAYVYAEPVQYTGFKLFYKNDTKKGHPLMKPSDILALFPKPLYIQYQ
ncbi:MAG TPA: hypothetical protein VFD64_00290 [Gemmatimonadaceae bacterium]|nr:hypothetical protein [Gemmatimonadaceae bacterium]